MKAPPKGEGIVAATPRYSLPLPSFSSLASSGSIVVSVGSEGMSAETRRAGLGSPRPIDLDGDGRPEILIDANLKDGRSAIVIFRLATRP